MARVCAPGGRLVVVDMYASEDPAKAAEFNRLERLRDPSHMRSLTLPELKSLFGEAGLQDPEASFYELRDEVRNLLARSFPEPGDDVKIIELFKASAADDRLGVPVHIEGEPDPLRLSGGDPRCATPGAMSIPAPFEHYEGEVLPEWIDANDHMNLSLLHGAVRLRDRCAVRRHRHRPSI